MRSLSIVAVALLGTALSTANAQQVKTTHTAPTKGQHTTLKSANGRTQLPPLLGTRPTNPAKPLVATNGPSHNSFVSGGTDACGAATPIGEGVFNGDNVGATTDGPNNCGAMCNDVWYDYTASFTGPAIFSLCGSGYDTVISVYDGAACVGPLLACNDDTCGFQSQVTVPVVNTQHYRIQIGGFSCSVGNYTMSVGAAPTCPCGPDTEGEGAPCGVPADAFNGGCNSTPVVYSTIACGGSVCGNGAFNGSFRDTDWYHLSLPVGTWQVTWTCTAEFIVNTGIIDYNNCPNVNIFDFDYGTGPCSATTSTFTFNGPTDIVLFAAPAFSTIINCGTNDTYHGDVVCTPVAPPGPCDSLDDGTSENAVGFAAPTGTDILWMQQGGSPGVTTTLEGISTCWGTAAFPGNGPAAGSTQRIQLWQDTDGGDATSGLVGLLHGSASGNDGMDVTVVNVDNDTFDEYSFGHINLTGIYWISASSEGAFPSPLDQAQAGAGRSWIVGSTTGAATIVQTDSSTLAGATVAPLNEDNVAPGVWMIRPDCDVWGTFEYECFGDGSLDEGVIQACPCGAPPGNIGAPGHGCRNSQFASGAILSVVAGGTASIGANNMQFTMTGHRTSTTNVTLVWAGDELPGRVFSGDGVRCIGNLRRIYLVQNDVSGTLTTPAGTKVASADPAVIPGGPGTIRGYYWSYREPVNHCSPFTFNNSNSCTVAWGL